MDAYLALNFGNEFFGDWYASREPGAVDDSLRVRGVKIHVDNGEGSIINWTPEDLTEAVGRANGAGWQVSAHAVSTEAVEMLLDAFEAAIGPTGPNPLHHRIEHAIQVSDDQLARMVAMDLATVIHLDGVAGDWVTWSKYLGQRQPRQPRRRDGLARPLAGLRGFRAARGRRQPTCRGSSTTSR